MAGLKVLLIGGGGREHALAWAAARSPRVAQVVCAPGNGGMAALGRCLQVDQTSLGDLLRVVAAEQPDLTIIGPELPLALGLADELARRSLPVFGPTRAAAALETSKSFAKRFMQRHTIPTAHYAVCASEPEALEALDLFHMPVVIKADGLHAGKGVIIAESLAEAQLTLSGLFSGRLLGTPETTVIIEEFLEGEEISWLMISDSRHVTPLLPAQDHKRVGEGDTGRNTGGMGAYTLDSMLAPPMQDWILHHIAEPTIAGMAAEDTPFKGVLFLGLMMTSRGPVVLEYNTRFGDPETQSVLVRLENDLIEGLEACLEERLSESEFRWRPGASACVVAAAAGYPGSYASGQKISGLAAAAAVPGVELFHAGTRRVGEDVVTAGGRVLGVTATAPALEDAVALAYQGVQHIHFDGMYYRPDIGHRALKR